MRGAPSVSVPVGRSRLGLYLAVCLWSLGVLTWLAWVIASPVPGRQGLVALIIAGCGVWAWRSQRRMPPGLLHWSGKAWFLWGVGPQADDASQEGLEVSVTPTMDFQSVLLLRVSAVDSNLVGWWWLTRGEDAANWQAVRRAVHGPRPAAAGHAGLAPHP